MAIKEQIAQAIASNQITDVYYLIVGKYTAQKKYGGFTRAKSYFYEGLVLERALVNAKDALKERDGKAELVVLSHSNSFFRHSINLSKEDLLQ